MSSNDWFQTLPGCLARAAQGGLGRAPEGSEEPPRAAIGLRFIDGKERARYLSYQALWQRCEALAAALLGHGVVAGDRVALMLPTSEDFPLAFFAAALAGAVPVPLYPPVRLGRIEEHHRQSAAMMRGVGARLLLTDERVRRVLGGALARYRPELGCRTVRELMPEAPPPRPPRWQDRDPDEIALIQFSSGTITDPKPIALTHRQVLANATRIDAALLDAYPEDQDFVHAGVCWLPLYHDMGLVGCLIMAVVHPAELTLIPPECFVANPAIWPRAIARYRASVSPAPNFAYSLCAERIDEAALVGNDLSCWKVALNGAEPVTPSALANFAQRFGRFGLPATALSPVYGLAEASLAVTFSPLREPFREQAFDTVALVAEGRAVSCEVDTAQSAGQQVQRLVSVGRPLPNFALKIVGPQGEVLPEGRLGRVWVRGPSLMRGYYRRPDLDALALVEGWLDTGDEGFVESGELFLFGRSKDIIILNGCNIAPQEVELALDDLPGVRKGCSAALGIVLEAGERLHLFVEVERDFDGSLEALGEAVAERIAGRLALGQPQVVLLAPGTLPRTSSGKIRRSETRRRYQAGELTPPKRVGPILIAKELLRSWIVG